MLACSCTAGSPVHASLCCLTTLDALTICSAGLTLLLLACRWLVAGRGTHTQHTSTTMRQLLATEASLASCARIWSDLGLHAGQPRFFCQLLRMTAFRLELGCLTRAALY